MPNIKIQSKHILDYCEGCKTEMVRCATCNNNCCNGSSGPVPGYDMSCPDCNEAYEHQTAYWNDPNSVKFLGKKIERHR